MILCRNKNHIRMRLEFQIIREKLKKGGFVLQTRNINSNICLFFEN